MPETFLAAKSKKIDKLAQRVLVQRLLLVGYFRVI